jgi:hypothetical protein
MSPVEQAECREKRPDCPGSRDARRYEFVAARSTSVWWYRGSSHRLEGPTMLLRTTLAMLLAAAPLAAGQQQEEKPKVPKDSIMAVITGCIKGRVIRADDVRQTDTTSGVNITQNSFRIAGKKDVMAVVKEKDGERVEMTGIIKKSALIEPGIKFKGGRVMVGGGTSGGTGTLASPAENVVVIDALAVTAVGGSCSGS